ncbi:xanthine dehydrogenase YagT iron-sulfur-binding subunit [Chromohalobacter canadensis]|uniref:Xanthine dehydrogenase YagT iron-sulfur-binding subunit n=1 Tax=Chromohalobacter canadensis TaxID=141389 RepID=A0A285VPQ5_9GAMM|nr:(2Fe-2S)-binding protein [Chromohalobacter canadensis]SOC54591.1 xanthine dehydrogenase YagT iron-sulfur-binding subunit [Chromohalobacter canadensis]
MNEEQDNNQPVSRQRRRFLVGSAQSGAAALFLSPLGNLVAAAPLKPDSSEDIVSDARTPQSMALEVNGKPHSLRLDTRMTLLDALREEIGLTGTKKGCDHGQCGACTVLVDGRRELSCLTLAVAAQGREIQTIEGLANSDGELHPMQQAFIEHDAFQCGYCTPGQILSAIGCVREGHADTPESIREFMSGNLCRCAAYPNIVAAVTQVRQAMEE